MLIPFADPGPIFRSSFSVSHHPSWLDMDSWTSLLFSCSFLPLSFNSAVTLSIGPESDRRSPPPVLSLPASCLPCCIAAPDWGCSPTLAYTLLPTCPHADPRGTPLLSQRPHVAAPNPPVVSHFIGSEIQGHKMWLSKYISGKNGQISLRSLSRGAGWG